MIQINQITKSFGRLEALKNVSLEVESGSIFGLIGTNGAGKSTLLRIMAGIYRPDAGQILLDGQPVYENPAVKAQLFYIADDPYYFNNASLAEMAAYYKTLYPNFSDTICHQLTTGLQLDKNRKLSTFSKGMLRQAMIILAFASQARYVFFDETFDGLDPVMRQAVKGLIASAVAEDRMVPVIASHNLRELEDTCDHVAVVHQGETVLTMQLDDIHQGIHKVQCAFNEVPEREWFSAVNPIDFQVQGRFCTLVARASREDVLDAVNAHQPVFLESMPLTLEEIFIAEMGGVGYEIQNILL